MPYSALHESILAPGLCASCGGCVAACPAEVLELDDESIPTPRLAPAAIDDACGTCNLCLDVCPGRDPEVPASERRRYGRARRAAERWTGIRRNVYAAQSPVEHLREAAAAGGGATALLVAALRSGLADAALVVGRDLERPWVPAPVVTADEDVVVACAQSTYCIAPNLQALATTEYERIAMVGVPCELQSLEKMRRLEPVPSAAARVAITLELACSSSTRRVGTEFLIEERLRLPLAEVASVRYRDGTYPGAFTVVDRDGDRHTLPFHELVTDFKRFKTHRCSTCPDWWSGLADVSICDADENIFQTSRDGTTMPRASLAVTRSDVGEELVAAAAELGLLRVGPGELHEERNLGLQRKRNRYLAARAAGKLVPAAPAEELRNGSFLSDDDVIERLSAEAPKLESR